MSNVQTAVLMLLALVLACDTNATKSPERAGAAPMSQTPSAHASDQMFIDGMVPHHEGAVEMARIALERAEHPELRAMAQGIITGQQSEIAQMKGWRKAWFGSDATPAMGSMSHDMPGMAMPGMAMPGMASMADMPGQIEALKTATPFDLAFLDTMIPHHEGALAMAKNVQDTTQMSEIKDLATKIMAAQTKEIAQMKEWRRLWFPTAPAIATP